MKRGNTVALEMKDYRKEGKGKKNEPALEEPLLKVEQKEEEEEKKVVKFLALQ